MSSLSFLDCVGAALAYVGDSWNVWDSSWFMWETSGMCGRITVFRLVVLFDLVLTPGGSVGFELPECSSKQSS